MSLQPENVPNWIVRRGIGHAVFKYGTSLDDVQEKWVQGLCGDMFMGDWDRTKQLPKRICRRCRDVLKLTEIHPSQLQK